MKKLVLFDCDGVLINTEETGYGVMSEMLVEHGIHYSRTEYVEMLSGITYEEFHAKLRAEHPELPDSSRDELDARMKAANEENMKAIDGIVELLQDLKDRDIPFAVCSNSGAQSLIEKLKAVGLYDYFEPFIFSRHSVDNPKPAPDMYERARQAVNRVFKTNIRPEDCIVVEDSITGTMAGVAAGMNVIGFVGESHRDAGEAELLVNAGAHMIALSVEQIGQHIDDFYGPLRSFPFMGPDIQL